MPWSSHSVPMKLITGSLLSLLALITAPLPAETDRDKRLDDFAANRTETGQPEVYARIQREAADFRVKSVRNRDRLPLHYQQKAERALQEITDHLIAGNPWPAYSDGDYYWHKYQYSTVSAELCHATFRGVAAPGRVQRAMKKLVQLWYYYPEYPQIHEAMLEAMLMAEGMLIVGEAIDFTATTPGEIVQWEHVGQYRNLDDLLAFLARFGDRASVAPRALLAKARADLFLGADSPERLIDAQIAYGQLLRRYPQYEELVFQALCELALVHLISYKGDAFNVTELIEARWVLDRASLLSNDRPDRRALVNRYRELVDRWTQDRDLYVGTWYDRQVYGVVDLFGRWFADWGVGSWRPPMEAQFAAQYYYRQTLRLGRTSEPAREAIRRIDAYEQRQRDLDELATPTNEDEAASPEADNAAAE